MSKAGETENKDREIKFDVNSQTFKYLTWLSENTMLGRGHNEVARQVLIGRLSEMRGQSHEVEKL